MSDRRCPTLAALDDPAAVAVLRSRILRKSRPVDGCWIWTGTRDRGGYGRLDKAGPFTRAHRASYLIFVGEIPDGLTLDHLCGHPACVNPGHLEPVSVGDNVRRAKAQVTQCPRGHRYTPENTRIDRVGSRKCRACQRERDARRPDRGRAAA